MRYSGLPSSHPISDVSNAAIDSIDMLLIVRSHIDIAEDVVEELI